MAPWNTALGWLGCAVALSLGGCSATLTVPIDGGAPQADAAGVDAVSDPGTPEPTDTVGSDQEDPVDTSLDTSQDDGPVDTPGHTTEDATTDAPDAPLEDSGDPDVALTDAQEDTSGDAAEDTDEDVGEDGGDVDVAPPACDPAECSDGNPCNGQEGCDEEAGTCVAGEAIECDDGNACNGLESCNAEDGECAAGEAIECDDGDGCNGLEVCNADDGQCADGDAVECDDGDVCNGLEICNPVDGECLGGEWVDCDDGDACTGVEGCNPINGECTAGEEVVCLDADACNGVEKCNPKNGACQAGEPVVCDDDDACNGVEKCNPKNGQCVAGEAVECDDDDACNGLETCDSDSGQCIAGEVIACDDGDVCNGLETCDSDSGDCAAGQGLACDDENDCTDDACDPKSGCSNVDNALPCDDDNPCTVDDACSGGTCLSGELVDEDGDGFGDEACGGEDCDDAKLWVHPGAPEICNDLDDDCDGSIDEVPAEAITCEEANDVDTDGSCDGWDPDPTGDFASAQIIDLGESFANIRLNFIVDFDDEGCIGSGQLHGSVDGQTWEPYWSGGTGWHDVFVEEAVRYVRAGSDDCGVHYLSVDPLCLCSDPQKLTCAQFHELSAGKCCCWKSEHILKITPTASNVILVCQSETGFNQGCASTIAIDISLDGKEWTTVESESWTSKSKPGGGWERLETNTFVEQSFTYIRGSSKKADGGTCYMDYFGCDIIEPCEGKYNCDGPNAPNCDDDDPCTMDTCDDVLGCQFITACPSDGNPCTLEYCVADPNPYCAVDQIDCNDGLLCTVDTCDPESGDCSSVDKEFNNPACDDGQPCSVDRCENGACVHDAVVCVDDDPCQDAGCNPQTGQCESNSVACDDGNPCTADTCEPGAGCAFEAISCDDANICTVDTCDENADPGAEPCQHIGTPQGVEACDDAKPCTVDTCSVGSGTCQHVGKDCNDGVACTEDSCDPNSGGCINDASNAGCDDQNACTSDTCQGGCQHSPISCNDGNKCTNDSCDPDGVGCINTAKNCDDGNKCNGSEYCVPASGQCANAGNGIQCNDGNPCNGQESCVPATGQCSSGDAIVCDDGDGCNGPDVCDPQTGGCVSVPDIGSCPVSPDECKEDGDLYGPNGSKSVLAGSSDMLRLRDSETTAALTEIIEDIQDHASVQKVTYSHILSDLNRQGSQVAWVIGVECFAKGYKFNSGDNKAWHWWPQGMAGSATGDSQETSVIDGHNVHLVSWYHKPQEDDSTNTNKGMRLSFVRKTFMDDIRYRHILMVEPYVDDNGKANFKRVSGHAGGLVWYKNLLYVADTSKGFRVFDMNHLMRVKTGDKNAIGYQVGKGEYHAFNYKYVLPMVNRYKLCGESCCARFSFCGLDMSTDPPLIVAGEYTGKNKKSRLHSWKIDPATGWLDMDPGQDTATADVLFYPAVIRMQGAVSWGGEYYISSSDPKGNWPQTPGTLYFAKDGTTPKERGYPTLPEDLHHNHYTGYLWTVTEHPYQRYVFSVHRAHAKSGCN